MPGIAVDRLLFRLICVNAIVSTKSKTIVWCHIRLLHTIISIKAYVISLGLLGHCSCPQMMTHVKIARNQVIIHAHRVVIAAIVIITEYVLIRYKTVLNPDLLHICQWVNVRWFLLGLNFVGCLVFMSFSRGWIV